MYYVYVLQSLVKTWYYIGQTHDIEKRIVRHNAGRVSSTKSHKPFKVVHVETYNTRNEAYRREHYLKSLKGGVTFKNIISIN